MSDAAELRRRINRIGVTQNDFGHILQYLGDDRDLRSILRSLQRMLSGGARVSGEMKVLLTLWEMQGTFKSHQILKSALGWNIGQYS